MPRSASAVRPSLGSASASCWRGAGSTSSPSICRTVRRSAWRAALERSPRSTLNRTSGSSIVPRFATSTSARPSTVARTRRYRSCSQISIRFVGRRCSTRTVASRWNGARVASRSPPRSSPGYVTRAPSTSANAVTRCKVECLAAVMCSTWPPRAVNASATRVR